MSERPSLTGVGTVFEILDPGRLYRVQMKNGHTAYAVVPKAGPHPAEGVGKEGAEILVGFSAFDMSRCKVLDWKPSNVETEP